jgi:hypothetical protein
MPRHLYWSRYETYTKCPQKFLWKYGHKGIDVGGGEGKPKPEPVEESKHNAIVGIVVANFMDEFYKKEWYKNPETLHSNITQFIARETQFQIQSNNIDWTRAKSHGQMEQSATDAAIGFLATFKQHRLLGPYAKSELDLRNWIEEGAYPIGGRPDLVLKREKGSKVSIFDGKMSRRKRKGVNEDQLLWYGLLFWLSYNVIPSELGWIWYSYPYGMENDDGSVESGVELLDFNKQDLLEIASKGKEMIQSVSREEFDATPKASYCNYCIYESVCDARIEQRRKNSEKRRKNKKPPENINGIVDFDLNDL